MIAPELKKYIVDATQIGMDQNTIQSQLMAAGWSSNEINRAFQELAQPAGSLTPVHKNPLNFKKIIIAIICLLTLGLGGGGAYAYYTGYFVSPEKVSNEAFATMKDAKSVSFDTTITIDASGIKDMIPAGVSDTATIGFKGAYDFTNKEIPQFQGDFDLQSGMFGAGFAVRLVNKIVYGELTKLKIPNLPLPVDVNQYLNKWYSFDYEAMKDSPLASSIPTEEAQILTTSLTSEQKTALEEIVRNAHFVKNVQKLKMEKIDGVYSYHFSFDLDHEGLRQYFLDVIKYMSSIDTQGSANMFSDVDTEQLDRMLSTIQNFNGEVWIGRNDHLLHKMTIDFDLQDTDLLPGTLKISVVSLYKDWNKPIDIQAPADSIDIKSLFESALGDYETKAKEAGIQAIVVGTRVQAVLYAEDHNDNYKGFCLSPDMKENFANLKEAGVPISNVVCKENKTAYAMSVKLPDDTFLCADSTGEFGPTDKHITTTACVVK